MKQKKVIEISCGKADAERRNLIKMLDYTPLNVLKNLKAVIMREEDETKEWNVFLCKTDVRIDTGAGCNINDMQIADVLTILAQYEIETEIRYDYFYDYKPSNLHEDDWYYEMDKCLYAHGEEGEEK